ncbi:AAA family ATPase [Alkalihalobacillus trypoxylicola]|uniref:Stage V sporulation protein K n=1 Tax=Alkalihalobacillus trypoxylicola TaxID=519424 RepID=A0A161PMU0_9BACI|nr:AAA family ATPase [Alkalihalobacillus trypoxylicola]KYG34879.1 stage V sporulation protein K [Alkalihalobacillus trypoxylicola]
MKNKQWTIDQIEDWIKDTDNHSNQLSESQAFLLIKQLEQEKQPSEKNKELRSLIYTKLVEKRWSESHRLDTLSKSWMEQAIQLDGQNIEIKKYQLEKILEACLEFDDFPEQLPVIRETDHSSTKKERAEQYYHLAEQFFQNLEKLEVVYRDLQNHFNVIEHDSRTEEMKKLVELYKQFEEPFLLISKATREYAKSISGIYYSAEQLKQIKEATNQIEQLSQEWKERLLQLTDQTENTSALEQLNDMIGLAPIKKRIHKLYQYLQYQKKRTELGFRTRDAMSLHMIFIGNPGTGKTSLARLMAKIYYELGLLEHETVLEVDRSQLVGAYVGQTEEQTMRAIEKANGGVLFIDEAYSLKRTGADNNDFGQTVIDTLVSAMTNEKLANTFAVILAGYPEEMNLFLRSNPGLRSRFPEQNLLLLEDYSMSELLKIGESVAKENDFILTEAGLTALKERIERAQVDDSFGNARTVKNIVLDAIFEKGSSQQSEELGTSAYILLDEEDFLPKKTENEDKEALVELQSLIGLENVKKEIKKMTAYIQVQQLRRQHHMKTNPITVHTIFTGASGTGKTTVASLYAKALKEIGLLKRGHLVVASRADLVAGYTGQTARKTKEKIKDALGGVLFIDEAYSLYSEGRGDFGKEAMATLLQEMSIHQENIVVILAGYEEEMQQLLSSNPGIRSRFSKEIDFPSYNRSELLAIIEKQINDLGYKLSEKASSLLVKLIPETGHSGNGRFATNLVQKIIQAQAERLVEESEMSKEDLMMVKEEDLQAVSEAV